MLARLKLCILLLSALLTGKFTVHKIGNEVIQDKNITHLKINSKQVFSGVICVDKPPYLSECYIKSHMQWCHKSLAKHSFTNKMIVLCKYTPNFIPLFFAQPVCLKILRILLPFGKKTYHLDYFL